MLSVQNLEARRGRRLLFSGLDWQAGSGCLVHVTGANGAGKTTLLRVLVGLGSPSAGRVLWHGEPVGAVRDSFHAGLIWLGHAAALKDELSARENLAMLLALGGQRVDALSQDRALADAGLAGRESLPARALSAGQRRRVALARLLLGATRPLWVLDEPFNTLDVEAAAWLAALIARQVAAGGIVVLTSHQPLGDALVDGAAVRRLTVAL